MVGCRKRQNKTVVLQYPLNVTRDMSRSLKALERENLSRPHRRRVLKRKKTALSDLLGFSAQGTLVRSRFQNVTQMDAPSHFFLVWNVRMGRGDSCIPCGPTLDSCCMSLLTFVGVQWPSMRTFLRVSRESRGGTEFL